MTDFAKLLQLLSDRGVEFIIIGGAAAISELEAIRETQRTQE